MNPIIAIEGISFAGKTTLTKLLEEQGLERLYELAEKFDYGAGFPSFPKTTDEARESDLWFIQQEVTREQNALIKSSRSVVVADRSFISGLAFGYARQEVFGLGDAIYQNELVRQALSQGLLHIPWLVYLKMDINTYFKRKENETNIRIKEYGEAAVRNVSISKEEKKFFEKQIEFYTRLFKNVPHLELDALEIPYLLATQVRTWVKGKETQFNPVNLEDFLVKPMGVER